MPNVHTNWGSIHIYSLHLQLVTHLQVVDLGHTHQCRSLHTMYYFPAIRVCQSNTTTNTNITHNTTITPTLNNHAIRHHKTLEQLKQHENEDRIDVLKNWNRRFIKKNAEINKKQTRPLTHTDLHIGIVEDKSWPSNRIFHHARSNKIYQTLWGYEGR